MGYLNVYPVDPKFPVNCPRPTRWEIRHLSINCQDYINSLSTCQIPNPNDLRVRDEPECRQWIQENLNYNACVRTHQRDLDFWQKEWRAWLGINKVIYGRLSDSIRLYDTDGHLVDRRDY
ncbi:MAG: hypothetical protein ACK4NX_01705 [Candidatus Paceibacteria bacterium]